MDLLEGHICSCKLTKPVNIQKSLTASFKAFIFIVPLIRVIFLSFFFSSSRHKDCWYYCTQVQWDDIKWLPSDWVFFRNKTSVVHILIYHLSLSQAFPSPYFIFYYFPLPLFFFSYPPEQCSFLLKFLISNLI